MIEFAEDGYLEGRHFVGIITIIDYNLKMAENKKEPGFMDMIKDVISFLSRIIPAVLFPPIAESIEVIMNNFEDRMMMLEKKMLRKIFSLAIISVGGIFLIFALLFFIVDSLGWSRSTAFFSIGIIIFVIGLLMKVGELMIENDGR